MMEEIIASGKADIIYMARQLLADNQFPNKVMANRDDEIVHCLRCFTCMAERASTFTRRCTVNPLIGRENEGFGEIPKSPEPKKVLVVGGGPGGLYAAYTAARRGHQVILCEATDRTGGLLIGEAAIPFKYDMYLLGETYRHMAEKAGVEIRLNTRVDRAYVEKEAPDALIVAAGSEPLLPPIPGLRESPIMFPAEDYHLKKDQIGDTCIVLGGGLVGCEMAVCLARDGKNVHLVEMRDQLCPDANVRYRPLLMAELDKVHVDIHLNCTCKRVEGNSVFCETPEGETVEIKGDSILAGLGLVPKTDVVEELRGTAPKFFSIGNCVRPDTITHAVYQGYHAALDV